MFLCLRRIQNPFSSVAFAGRIMLKPFENKQGPRGSGGMLPENLHTVEAILVLFEQFSGKFCLIFLALILSVSPNMMHFIRTFSIVMEKVRNYEKIVSIKNMFENGWWGDASHPRSAPDMKTLFWSSPDFSRKTVSLRT